MEHSKEFEQLVAAIMPNVKEISVDETLKKIKNGATLMTCAKIMNGTKRTLNPRRTSGAA